MESTCGQHLPKTCCILCALIAQESLFSIPKISVYVFSQEGPRRFHIKAVYWCWYQGLWTLKTHKYGLDKGLKAAVVPAAALGVLCGGDHQLVYQYDAWCLLQCLWGLFKRPLLLRLEHSPDGFNYSYTVQIIGLQRQHNDLMNLIFSLKEREVGYQTSSVPFLYWKHILL
jgi:hypothetical protein